MWRDEVIKELKARVKWLEIEVKQLRQELADRDDRDKMDDEGPRPERRRR